jgi:PIN like domain
VTAVDVLDREMYSEAEAARLLRVAQGTLHYWLEGGTQRGRTYKPIVRLEPTGARSVTWAEFVEAALLRDLLGLAKILARLRPDITYPGDPGAVVHKRQRSPCPVCSPAIKDSVWIPQVAGLGWLIITRDSAIQRDRAELAAVQNLVAATVPWRLAWCGDLLTSSARPR